MSNSYLGNDPWLLVILAVFFLSWIIQGSVTRTFRKYSDITAASGRTAADMAQQLLSQAGSSVHVTEVSGTLTDHYNPKTETVGLSNVVYGQASVSALAVAAHEIGHVMQYQEGYGPIKLRNLLLPVAKLGSGIAPIIILIGLFMNAVNLAMVGVWLYAGFLLFQVATLPVEFNASNRGIQMLTDGGYISYDQVPMAKKVLRAAAMTYVISALATFATLMRFLSFTRRRD